MVSTRPQGMLTRLLVKRVLTHREGTLPSKAYP